jgi:mannose-6-phosphate isomerase-like protein (cupin superfamily)
MVDHEFMKTLPQVEIETIHHEADGLYTKEIRLPAGVAFGKHMHNYSHQSFLGKGKVKLIRDDREDIIEAPACILVEAGVWHTVEALTDVVWFCTHNTDRADVEELH